MVLGTCIRYGSAVSVPGQLWAERAPATWTYPITPYTLHPSISSENETYEVCSCFEGMSQLV